VCAARARVRDRPGGVSRVDAERWRPWTRGVPRGAAARGTRGMRARDDDADARTASRGERGTSSRAYEAIVRAERAAARERAMEVRRNASWGNGQEMRGDDLEGDPGDERWRESERERGRSTFAAFDARLARSRARAESAREDAARIERWLRDSSAAAASPPGALAKADGFQQVFTDEDARDETRRMEATYQRSPTRSVIHRPIPSRPLSSSVEGTGWTKKRTSGTTFREFGTAHSVRSEENSRSAFQSLMSFEQPTERLGDAGASTTGIGRAQASEGVSTPPRIQRSPALPPRAHPRVRTMSEDFTAMSMRPVRMSADVMRNSTSSRMTLLESVAQEAEHERAIRMSEVSEDSADFLRR